MSEGVNPELTLANVQRAIDIHEEIEKDKPLKSVHLGRYLYFKGTILIGLKRFKETVRAFEQSKEILSRVPEFQDLVNQLTYEIENLRSKIEQEEEEVDETPTDGGASSGKKVKADDESDFSAYLLLGAVSAVAIAAAFAIMRLRRA